MSVRKETYIITGCKFDEEFTKLYWKQNFYDGQEWDNKKPKDEPFFISDGMNGEYTFFGYITQLSNGREEDYEIKSIDFDIVDVDSLIEKFSTLFPNLEVPEVKLYYLPHYV